MGRCCVFEMTTTLSEILLSRLATKDAEIEAFQKTIARLQTELADVNRWIEEHCANERAAVFEWEQLQAKILGTLRTTS